MGEQRGFIERLVALLEAAEIRYMLTGSLGSSFHGHPRATNDVDLVIAPTESQLRRFVNSLGSGYYVSEEAALAALSRRSAFNVIEMSTQWKADLRVRSDRPFSLMEFGRRRQAPVLGLNVWVVSPEDAILSKLEWAKESDSPQQMKDVLGVLQAQRGNLDEQYLRRWAEDLGVRDRLIEVLEQAKAESEQCHRDP